MQLRPRRRPVLLLAVLGLGAGFLLAAILSSPHITGVSPADAARDVSGRAPLRISFSRPMDRASAEARLSIDPPVSGAFRWDGNAMVYEPELPWPPGGHVTARLAAGARSARGLPVLGGITWAFDVGVPHVIYQFPASGPSDLYSAALDPGDPQRLTNTAGVLDFRLTADGSALVYAVLEAAGQDAVHLRDLATGADRVLYACSTGQVCRDGALSPDGRWLAFEREDQGPEGAPAGAVVPQVFLVAVGQDDEAFPIAAADHSTSSPSWSSRGWLEYYDHTLQAYAFVAHPTSPEQPADRYVPNALGDRGVWSPDGESFVFPEIVFVASAEDDERPPLYYSHLYRLNVGSGAILDLSGETVSLVEDTGPAYSPDGLWLAFSRKYLDPGRWTLGHQIWRMRSDGLTPEALTDVPARNHSALTWSPDGRYLAYMEFDQVDMTKAAEIWWMALDGSASGSLASGGYAPQWSP